MLPSTSDDGSDVPLKRQRRHGVITAGKSVDHCTTEMPFDGGCYVTATIGRKRFRGILVEDSKLEELAMASTVAPADLTFTSLLEQLAPQPYRFPIAEPRKNARPGRPRKSGPQTVVIVGAGLSGLAAAKELEGHGFKVIVLEARSEIGGRLRSGPLHPIGQVTGATTASVPQNTTSSVSVDLGASWVHGITDNPITAIASAAGVTLVNTTANTIIQDGDGTPIPQDQDEHVDKLFNHMLDIISREHSHPHTTHSVGNMLQELLRVHETSHPLSPVERRLFRWHITNQEYATGADITDLSPLELSETIDFDGPHCMVQGGYRQLATFLAANLADIRLDSPVTRINYGGADQGEVKAENGRAGSRCQVYVQGSEEPIVADAVLVTSSLGVLKAGIIEFSPPLPEEVQQAIHRIGFGVINKVFLEFPWKFWGDADQIGCASEDGQFFLFYDHFRVSGHPILMTLVPGSRGERLEAMEEGAVMQSVMERLRVVFKDQQVPDPVKYYITKWRSDHYTRGSYSYLKPGASWVDMQQLQQSVRSKLFFAGEATIPKYNASTHGAYMSGIERARMICEALRPSKRRPDHYTPRVPNPGVLCEMCNEGTADRALGALIGTFHDGDESFFVHECCAVFSPEVTQQGGVWYNVAAAARRGKKLACAGCKQKGATIGCNVRSCKKSYHVACAMRYTRWSFERADQGKHFLCTEHRPQSEENGVHQASSTTLPNSMFVQQSSSSQLAPIIQQPNISQLQNLLRMQGTGAWQGGLGGMNLSAQSSLDAAAAARPSMLAFMHALMSAQQSPTAAMATSGGSLPMPMRYPAGAAIPHHIAGQQLSQQLPQQHLQPHQPHQHHSPPQQREADQFQQHQQHHQQHQQQQHQQQQHHAHQHHLHPQHHPQQPHQPQQQHIHHQSLPAQQQHLQPQLAHQHVGHETAQTYESMPDIHNGTGLVGPGGTIDGDQDRHNHRSSPAADGNFALL